MEGLETAVFPSGKSLVVDFHASDALCFALSRFEERKAIRPRLVQATQATH